jgi:plasmid replication initiation protein
MSNALTRAAHGLTLAEKRLIAFAIGQLDSRRVPKFHEQPVVKITAAEYAESFDVDPSNAYKSLQSAAKQLYERSIRFYEPELDRQSGGKRLKLKKDGTPPMVTMRWVGSVKYHETQGWLELDFYHKVVPHLMGLRKQFTSYQLAQAHALRSASSWKLLELMLSWEERGWFEMPMEEFYSVMEATEKQRQNFAEIRRRLIEPAVKELTEKDNWLIQWHKTNFGGRRVSGLRFEFQRNPQGQLPLED